MMKMILASKSPRRIEILKTFSLDLEVIPSNYDERLVSHDLDPHIYVTRIAEKKGEVVAKLYPDIPILSADTTVYFKGEYYNKPASVDEAIEMLSLLSSNTHQVYTGVSVRKNDQVFSDFEQTQVHFRSINRKQIQAYVKSFSPLDKAGSYSIQDDKGILVDRIEGCFFNAIGLPVGLTRELLLNVGIDLWECIATS